MKAILALFLVLFPAISDAACVPTGRWLVRFLSFGRWRGEALNGNEARIHAAAGALTFVTDGMRVVTVAGLTLVGGTFYVLLLAAVLWLATSW